MQLRPELEPRPVDPERLERLTAVIQCIVDAWEGGRPDEALMREHDALAGRSDIPAERYRELYASQDEAAAATEALHGPARAVPDVTRDELVEIARRIVEEPTDARLAFRLELFALNTPERGDSDLFYWPDPDWLARIGTDRPSLEQIVDEALRPT